MIRKPINQILRIVLGILAFGLLIGGYTMLANRQYTKNPTQMTTPGWSKSQQQSVIDRELEKAQTSLEQSQAGTEVAEQLTRRIRKLEQANQQLQGDQYKSIFKGVRKILLPDGDDPPWLWADAGISIKRFALGIIAGTLGAFLIGMLMGCFSPVESLVGPPISFLASIPPTAMMVVYMQIFQLKPELFVAVIGIGIFPTLAQSVFQAVKHDVSDAAIDKAYTLGASHFEVIWEVIIPQVLPRVIDAIRLQVGPAMIFLIAVELIAGGEGIGYRLRNAPRGNHYNVIYIYLILLGVFGFAVDRALAYFRRWWCPWFGDAS